MPNIVFNKTTFAFKSEDELKKFINDAKSDATQFDIGKLFPLVNPTTGSTDENYFEYKQANLAWGTQYTDSLRHAFVSNGMSEAASLPDQGDFNGNAWTYGYATPSSPISIGLFKTAQKYSCKIYSEYYDEHFEFIGTYEIDPDKDVVINKEYERTEDTPINENNLDLGEFFKDPNKYSNMFKEVKNSSVSIEEATDQIIKDL